MQVATRRICDTMRSCSQTTRCTHAAWRHTGGAEKGTGCRQPPPHRPSTPHAHLIHNVIHMGYIFLACWHTEYCVHSPIRDVEKNEERKTHHSTPQQCPEKHSNLIRPPPPTRRHPPTHPIPHKANTACVCAAQVRFSKRANYVWANAFALNISAFQWIQTIQTKGSNEIQ